MKRRPFLKGMLAGGAILAVPQIANAATTHQVAIEGFAFVPSSLQVAPGDTIVFTNNDRAPHTATADDQTWNTGTLRQGESAAVEVVANMKNSYFCKFHRNMRATLTVG